MNDLAVLYAEQHAHVRDIVGSFARGRDPAAVEDATQAAWLRCWARRSEYPEISRAFVITIARNLLVDGRRRVIRNVPLDRSVEELGYEEDYDASEGRDTVERLLARLPDFERAVVRLRIIEGYSHAETVERLGSTTNIVKKAMTRARARLRAILHEEGV